MPTIKQTSHHALYQTFKLGHHNVAVFEQLLLPQDTGTFINVALDVIHVMTEIVKISIQQ